MTVCEDFRAHVTEIKAYTSMPTAFHQMTSKTLITVHKKIFHSTHLECYQLCHIFFCTQFINNKFYKSFGPIEQFLG